MIPPNFRQNWLQVRAPRATWGCASQREYFRQHLKSFSILKGISKDHRLILLPVAAALALQRDRKSRIRPSVCPFPGREIPKYFGDEWKLSIFCVKCSEEWLVPAGAGALLWWNSICYLWLCSPPQPGLGLKEMFWPFSSLTGVAKTEWCRTEILWQSNNKKESDCQLLITGSLLNARTFYVCLQTTLST